ncbi:MAG: amidohydrolase family protein [Bacteroidetes bacterium]|nr:amidohydrolase family protein [Bacteroidota bacterium]
MKLFLTLLASLLLFAPFTQTSQAQIAVKGKMVYTMAGEPIENGVVLIRDGKIERVGRFAVPSGYEVMEAAVVTPGLIDAHTVVGLAGYLNQTDDQDQVERSAPMQPELRAIDAYNPREALVEWVRSFGVTTLHTGHGPGILVSGQTMIVKTVGNDVAESVINPAAMVAVTLGEGGREASGSPGTRSKMISMLRGELLKAKAYDPSKGTDLRLEAFKAVLDGKMRLLVTVERSHDILTTLRLAEEFGIKIVLDSASEAYLVTDQIKAAGVPVLTHATMARHSGERANATFEAASILRDAGIPFALQSGFEAYVPKTRIVLFEAGVAAANGLSFSEALASITIDAAKLLGVDDRIGSLEAGKDADIALYDGDPFEYTTHAIGVIIDGKVVSTDVR